jgi:hypothetical protein
MQILKKIFEGILLGGLVFLLFLLAFENRLQLPAWLEVIGRMHPMFLHFPIALLILSFLTLWLPIQKENEWLHFLWLCAALSAVITSIMGLLLSLQEGSDSDVLNLHKWGGIAIALFGAFFYWFHSFLRNKKIIGQTYTVLATTCIIVAAHWGADITHGQNFILAPVAQEKKIVPVDQAIVFKDVIKPILDAKCMNCHGEASKKGGLLLEDVAGVLRGGKTGPLFEPGKPSVSLIIQRIHLPLQDKKHMPPAQKEQLTEDEASLLWAWIKSGAVIDKKVTSLPVEDSFRILATHYLVPSDNYIPDQPVYDFKAADESKIKSLNNNYRVIEQLGKNSPALSVNFYGKSMYSSKALQELLPVKDQIIDLNLAHMPVKNEDLKTIQQMMHLQKLNLNYTDITNEGLLQLSNLKDLEELSLSGTAVSAEALQKLLSLSRLNSLVIWNTKVDSTQALALRNEYKKINIETGYVDNGEVTMALSPPMIQTKPTVFDSTVEIKMKHPFKGVEMRYTLDGSEPDSVNSALFKEPVKINTSATLVARAFKKGWYGSEPARSVYLKKGVNPDSIQLLTKPDPKYTSPNGKLLSDNNLADLNFGNSTGEWLGYRKNDAAFLLYLNKNFTAQNVYLNMLENTGGYIFPPVSVEVWGGTEKNNLKLVGKITPQMPKKNEDAKLIQEKISFAPAEVKYMKIVVKPLEKLPKWHDGKGQRAWIFLSEVVVN